MSTAFENAWINDLLWQAMLGWTGVDQYDEANPVGQALLDEFDEAYGRRPEYCVPVVNFDIANVLLRAFADAHPLTPDGVRAALERVKMIPAASGSPGTYHLVRELDAPRLGRRRLPRGPPARPRRRQRPPRRPLRRALAASAWRVPLTASAVAVQEAVEDRLRELVDDGLARTAAWPPKNVERNAAMPAIIATVDRATRSERVDRIPLMSMPSAPIRPRTASAR